MSKFQNDLTGGSVSKNLIKFSLPFLLSNLIQTIYGVADLFVVGRFNGSESIAGVNLGGQITMLITSLVIGLATGGTVLIAQYLGAKREKDMKETIGTMFTIMFILAIVMTVLMLIAGGSILRLIQTPEEAFSEAKAYFDICMLGTIFIFGYNAISSILRGMGDSKNPLIFVSIACVVNIALDYILVGGFGMKAAGAALATVIAQAISMIISIIYLVKKNFIFDFKLSSFRIHGEKIKKLLIIGLPTSIQNTVSSLSFLTLASIVNRFGVNASAGAGIVGKINGFAILPAMAMSMSIASMAGQNIGAGLSDRAKETMKVGMKIAFGIGLVIFLIIQLLPGTIIGIFDNDLLTKEFGIQYIRMFSFDYLIVPFAFCANGLITGSGHTLYVAFNTILCSLILRMPLAYILGIVWNMGLSGVALAVPLSTVGSLILALLFIKSGKWKITRITE